MKLIAAPFDLLEDGLQIILYKGEECMCISQSKHYFVASHSLSWNIQDPEYVDEIYTEFKQIKEIINDFNAEEIEIA